MIQTTQIDNLFSSLQNGCHAAIQRIIYPYSHLCHAILDILQNDGYIRGYTLKVNQRKHITEFEIFLKYVNNMPTFRKIQRISTPGARIYFSIKRLHKLNNHLCLYILTTSKGLLSHKNAIRNNVGGEIICKIT